MRKATFDRRTTPDYFGKFKILSVSLYSNNIGVLCSCLILISSESLPITTTAHMKETPIESHDLEMDLIKTSRSLDRDGEAISERLDRVRISLSDSRGDFSAAEEMILRWLLKNMNGNSTQAEVFRRYPVTWSILGTLFERIPAKSLAQILHDRKFTVVLQQTVEDASKAQSSPDGEASNTEMGNTSSSKKRKRSDVEDDVAPLRQPVGCLSMAETLFEALATLIATLDLDGLDGQVDQMKVMGIEHFKSLFYTSASEAMKILAPLLRICNLALVAPASTSLKGQERWLKVIVALWKLHLRGATDAFEIATHFAPVGCIMLGKMMNILQDYKINLSPLVVTTWTKDLRQFLVKHMLVPSRSAYLHRKNDQILRAAVNDTPGVAPLISTVLFHLASKVPNSAGTVNAKKDTEEWLQHVFEVVQAPLANEDASARTEVLSLMLNASAERGIAPTSETLLAICRDHALKSGKPDWALLSSIALCEAEVFLDTKGGLELLSSILNSIPRASDGNVKSSDKEAFVISIAEGFVRAKDLTGFIKMWLEQLTLSGNAVWRSPALKAVVAASLQTSLSTGQFSALLEWLQAQASPETVEARTIVLDAISTGVNNESFQDLAGAKLFDMTSGISKSNLSLQCRILKQTLSWVDLPEVERLWEDAKSRLTAQPGKLDSAVRLEAFKCCCKFLEMIKGPGQLRNEVREAVDSFLKFIELKLKMRDSGIWQAVARYCRLGEDGQLSDTESLSSPQPTEAYIAWFIRKGLP